MTSFIRWLLGLFLRFTRTLDWPLLMALVALMGIGLAVLYSAGNENPRLVMAQGTRYGLGLAVMWLLSRVPTMQLRSVTPLVFAGSLLPLVVVLFIGQGKHGNHWINLGVFYFQPAELLKLSLPMMVAWYLHRERLPPRFMTVIVAGMGLAWVLALMVDLHLFAGGVEDAV
jgi:rod shape determining protein RodA